MSAASFEAPTGPVIRTLIPARIDRLPLVAVPHPDGGGARGGLGPRRARDHDRELRRRVLSQGTPSACPPPRSVRSRPSTCRRGRRRTAVRTAVRQARPAEALHRHAGRLPDRQRPDRVDPARPPPGSSTSTRPGSSRVPASAASTRRSTRRSTSSSRPGTAAGWTSRSTARTGPARSSARLAPRPAQRARPEPRLADRLSHRPGARRWLSCSSGATCRRARAG